MIWLEHTAADVTVLAMNTKMCCECLRHFRGSIQYNQHSFRVSDTNAVSELKNWSQFFFSVPESWCCIKTGKVFLQNIMASQWTFVTFGCINILLYALEFVPLYVCAYQISVFCTVLNLFRILKIVCRHSAFRNLSHIWKKVYDCINCVCVGLFVLGHAVAAAGYGCCGSLGHNLFTYFAFWFSRKMTRFILVLSVPCPHGVKAPEVHDNWYKNAHLLDNLFNPLILAWSTDSSKQTSFLFWYRLDLTRSLTG